MTGKYTFLIKLFCRDNEHLMNIVTEKLLKIPYIQSTETLLSLQAVIDRNINCPDADSALWLIQVRPAIKVSITQVSHLRNLHQLLVQQSSGDLKVVRCCYLKVVFLPFAVVNFNTGRPHNRCVIREGCVVGQGVGAL